MLIFLLAPVGPVLFCLSKFPVPYNSTMFSVRNLNVIVENYFWQIE